MALLGGEVASFWRKNPTHLAMLAGIGRRSLIKVAVSLGPFNSELREERISGSRQKQGIRGTLP